MSLRHEVRAGDTLTFKALQTYDDGEVVRWIGAPDSEEPAPRVAVTEGSEEHRATSDHSAEESSDDSDRASKDLGIAALIVGALGLLPAAAHWCGSRRA